MKITLHLINGEITNLNKLNDLPMTALPDLKKKVMQLSRGVTVPKSEPKGFNYKSELHKLVDDKDLIEGYLAVGKLTKRAQTKIGLQAFINECDKFAISYAKGMFIVIDKNWRGFSYSWLKDDDFEKYGLKKKVIAKPQKKSITMDDTKKIISDNAKIELTKKQINESFLSYMDDLQMPDFASIKFDFLISQGLIAAGQENANYYDRKRKLAIDQLKLEYDPENALSLQDKKAKELLIKYLNDGTSPQIEIRVKYIVLKEFFDAKIKSGETLIFEL